MMRLNFLVLAIAAILVMSLLPEEDLFSLGGSVSTDSLSLPSEISSDSGNLFLDDDTISDGDLFADSTVDPTTDFTISSGLDDLGDSSLDLLASCQSTNGQSASKLRARDNTICTPNGQASSTDGFIDNTLGIFGSPSDREEKLQGAAAASTTKNTNPACNYFDNEYPWHLCCAAKGKKSNDVLPKKPNMGIIGSISFYLRRGIFETMEDCELGT